MKKLTIGATLLFGLILSSCSTFKNVDIVKRRYNGGYHIAVRDQKTKTDPIAVKTDEPATVVVTDQPTEEPATAVNQEPQNPVGVQPAPVAASEKTVASGNDKTQSPPVIASVKKERAENTHKLRSPVLKSKTWSASSRSAAGDVDLIILVILAILLPPLAVYLVEEASTRFWITLILCLLSGGVGFFFVFGWGLWFVAMLIALLTVLK